jgi:hypothetical protein
MNVTTSNKKNHVILAMLSMIAVILLAGFYLQERQFSKYKERLNVNNLAENSRTELKAGESSMGKSPVQNNKETYKKKITRLENKIADMQKTQGHLEVTLNEYGEKDATAAPEMDAVSKARGDYNSRRIYSALYKDFFDQNNYSPVLNEKLVDLLVEKMGTMGKRMMNAPKDWENPKNWSKNIEFNKQTEAIKAQYDEKIAELLPEGGLALYKEYDKRQSERILVFNFETMLGDDTLKKEKERELIELLYEDTQTYAYSDKDFRNIPGAVGDVVPEKILDEETLDRLTKESAESMIKTYTAYVESAKGILSESQMVKFEGMVNSMRSPYLPPDDTTVNGNDKEKDKE